MNAKIKPKTMPKTATAKPKRRTSTRRKPITKRKTRPSTIKAK